MYYQKFFVEAQYKTFYELIMVILFVENTDH